MRPECWRLSFLPHSEFKRCPTETGQDEVGRYRAATDQATPLIITRVGDKCKKPWSVECKSSLLQKKKKEVRAYTREAEAGPVALSGVALPSAD